MKSSLVLLMLAALCFAGAGCDKPEPEAAPRVFDKAVDGVIAPAPVPLDPSVLKARPQMDIPVVAAAQPAGGATETPEAATPADQVRQTMAEAIEKVKQGDLAPFADLHVDEQAPAIRKLTQQVEPAVTALLRMVNVAEQKLGENPMALLASPAGGPGMVPDVNSMMDLMTMNVVSANEVHIFDAEGAPDGKALLLDGQWRLQLEDDEFAKISVAAEHPMLPQVVTAVAQACDQLTAGLENGSITRANFPQSVQMAMEQRVMPVMVGFMMTMGGDMAQPEEQPAEPEVIDPKDPYGGPLGPNPYGPAGGGAATW